MNMLSLLWIGAKMHHKNLFFNRSTYISMTLWPVLEFFGVYYAYKPFARSIVYRQLGLAGEDEVFVYLLLGFIGMMAFQVMIQGAWSGATEFRYSGTLELMYLSPASRIRILASHCIGYLFGGLWMTGVFCFGMFYLCREVVADHLLTLLTGFGLMTVSAISFGMCLYSLFLYSRDSNFLFTVFQTPVEMCTGAKIPFSLMPVWAKAIGYFIPLTYVIRLIREMVLSDTDQMALMDDVIMSLIVSILMMILSALIMKCTERHAMIYGSASMF